MLIINSGERKLAEFLIIEGVLLRDNVNEKNFKMSSIFIDQLIWQRVIPTVYKSAPTIPVPQTDDGFLKTLNILKESICCFDKTIISNAFHRSFKNALVKVNSFHNQKVPRESIYDTELNRILVNWIVKECLFDVTGQWHLIEHADNDKKDKHNYSDIVIISAYQRIVFELLATATKKELDEYFEKMFDYMKKPSANEI